MDKDEAKEGSQTCHLCGKVQCGQRLGRVKCSICNRIFCLQQLSRKFHITAQADDPYFKCPRCLGICCCVCNCTKPPPHVHCKVYKVRQNKLRQQAMMEQSMHTESVSPKPVLPVDPIPVPPIEDPSFSTRIFPQEPAVSPARWEGGSNTWSDPQALWSIPPLDLPGSRFISRRRGIVQNGDGLTQLSLRLLDNWDPTDHGSSNPSMDRCEACYVDYEGLLKFSDNLKMYFDGWEDMSEYDRNALISYENETK